jgi:hypothetical protein
LTSQAIDFVALHRGPTAKIFHALQKAEPEDLRIFAHSDEACRVFARRHYIASRKIKSLPGTILEFGCAANDAINNNLASRERGGVRGCRCALR